MSERECRCGRPTDAYFCHECGKLLSVALGEVPWVDEQLDVTVTRVKGVDYRTKGRTRSSDKPLPFNATASEARDNLRAVLVSWVRFCADERVRNSSPHQGIPEDTLPAISRWLLWRVDGLSLLDIGPEAVDEITSAVAHCHRLIDRPADRQYLGACDVCPDGKLYARPGGMWARCNACDQATEADKIRERLLGELDDRLCTAAEIAHLSTFLGLKANREQVRKRINQWHKRSRIASESMFDEPAFRFGIVWRLLVQEESKTSAGVA